MAPIREPLTVVAQASGEFPGWFVLAWVLGMWVLVTTLLGVVSGHASLLSRFSPVEEPVVERFSFVSGSMRRVPYQSALRTPRPHPPRPHPPAPPRPAHTRSSSWCDVGNAEAVACHRA
jgi:hypothetical protein